MLIFKILRQAEWDQFQKDAHFEGAPIDLKDGYIHFSTAEQALETAAKHFAGVTGLWLLALESDSFGAALKWEPSRGGALFPHLYDTLKMTDVIWSKPITQDDNGHVFPDMSQ